MNKYQTSIIPCTMRFKQPAGTSRGVYHDRKVWYILLRSLENPDMWGVGECAPLPGLSCDALPGYEYILADICRKFQQDGCIDEEELRPYPSILFGFETALAQMEARSFSLFDTSFSQGEKGIPINGLVWMGSYAEMLSRIEEKLTAGFRCVKLKIGAIGFEEELALIKHIRKHFTAHEIELRVDANGAFSPAEAMDKLNRLAELDLHSIEQPIRAGQWEELALLTAKSPLPIALDEELIGINTLEEKQRLLDSVHPQYIVFKPSLHGGMNGGKEWIEEAEKRDINWWITSALESNIGLNAIAQWCARFDNPLPQGLGTGQLFTSNVDLPLSIRKDCIWYNPREYSFSRFPHFIRQACSLPPGICETIQTSGSTGTPKPWTVRRVQMEQSARFTCDYLGLKEGDSALLCLPTQYIAGRMVQIRAEVAGLRLITCEPSGNPLAGIDEAIDFAAMTPMQVYNTLQVPAEKEKLKAIKILIIGGGAIDECLERELQQFPNAVYSTYGMTETLSHIALRRLNGVDASPYYIPFPSVKVSLAEDETLLIDAPLIADEILKTRDLATILPNGSFKILGRIDNVINSGGIKIQIERIEEKLRAFINSPYAITSVSDPKFGEMIVLLCEEELSPDIISVLPKFERPKYIWKVTSIPYTGNGKIDRASCRKIACLASACG